MRSVMRGWSAALALAVGLLGLPGHGWGQVNDSQWGGFAGDPQHTATSSVAAQSLDRIRWQSPVDLSPPGNGAAILIHYGSPVVTAANTVIVPVKTGASGGFRVDARRGEDGSLRWTMASDYVLPPHDWTPSFNPVLTPQGRLYVPGVGGTLLYRDQPDSPTGPTGRVAFYPIPRTRAKRAAYIKQVMINTPLTSDRDGNIFFGFQVVGARGLSLRSGIARVAADGTGTWIAASTAGSDPAITKVAHNSAPALSHDQRTLYVTVSNGNGSGSGVGYLVAIDSQTLAPRASVRLKDVLSGEDAFLPEAGTASPTVGPDGDVYVGVLENPFPSNHDRGWLLHFDSTLTETRIPGAFGWDDTASVVPAAAVPSYHGPSTYLLMTKYNNYAGLGGDGVNKLAVLDPHAPMPDPISGATVMSEVLTVAGPTPDPEYAGAYPHAVREWCINTAVVDPITRSVLANSEDGRLYRWDLTTNTLSQSITLTSGIGEAYTPTLIGADGTVYAINNAILFAVGQ